MESELMVIKKSIQRANYNDLPIKLLEIKDILKRTPSSHLQQTKKMIFEKGLLDEVIGGLTRDYLKVSQNWTTAASITELLVDCMNGLPLQNNESLLSRVADGFLKLLGNIQSHFRKHNMRETNLIDAYNRVLESLELVNQSFKPIGLRVIKSFDTSSKLMQAQITPNVERSFTQTLCSLVRRSRQSIATLKSDTINKWIQMLSEIICKSEYYNPLVLPNAKLFLELLNSMPNLRSKLKTNKKLLMAIDYWISDDHSIGEKETLKKLRRFILENPRISENLRYINEAATRIQATYRGYRVRRRLAIAQSGVTSLQRLFRVRLQNNEQDKIDKRKKEELEFKSKLSRLQRGRRNREKQLQLLGVTPARAVNDVMNLEYDMAATTIQNGWRLHRERRERRRRFRQRRENRAASVIQASYRRYTRTKREEYVISLDWPDLDEERREELQKIVDSKVHDLENIRVPTDQELNILHDKVQSMLVQYYSGRYESIKNYEIRCKLIEEANEECDLLDDMPISLDRVTSYDVTKLSSKNRTIALLGRQEHEREMKYRRSPEWMRMMSDQPDTMYNYEFHRKYFDLSKV